MRLAVLRCGDLTEFLTATFSLFVATQLLAKQLVNSHATASPLALFNYLRSGPDDPVGADRLARK